MHHPTDRIIHTMAFVTPNVTIVYVILFGGICLVLALADYQHCHKTVSHTGFQNIVLQSHFYMKSQSVIAYYNHNIEK